MLTTADGVPGNHSHIDDERAFARVLEELRPKLELIARQRGLADAEDVVQETLLAALLGVRGARFRGRSTVEGWIYGILRNKIADKYRSQAAESRHLVAFCEQGPPCQDS